ncbi:MAG: hypothetical protein QOJ48_1708 [Frankiales bacterium]|jgi:hypothetical protein|nr:hypothetical protein [Frankiales bacterium]
MDEQLLSTSSATTLLPACAEHAWQELLCLLNDLWPGDTEVLQACAGRRLVHAVLDEGEPDVWLTWLLEPLGPRATRVVLHLDELTGFAPDPELDGVLLALLSRCVPTLAG